MVNCVAVDLKFAECNDARIDGKNCPTVVASTENWPVYNSKRRTWNMISKTISRLTKGEAFRIEIIDAYGHCLEADYIKLGSLRHREIVKKYRPKSTKAHWDEYYAWVDQKGFDPLGVFPECPGIEISCEVVLANRNGQVYLLDGEIYPIEVYRYLNCVELDEGFRVNSRFNDQVPNDGDKRSILFSFNERPSAEDIAVWVRSFMRGKEYLVGIPQIAPSRLPSPFAKL